MSTDTPRTDGMEVWAGTEKDRDDMMKVETKPLTASSECPVCGVDVPHSHSREEIVSIVTRLREELAEAKREFAVMTTAYATQVKRAEQAEKELHRLQAIFDAAVAIQGDEEVLKYVNSLNGIPITRCTVSADLIRQLVDSRKQAEARALANEKDAGRYRFLRHNAGFTIRCSLFGDVGMREHKESDLDELIDSAITGDKHVG